MVSTLFASELTQRDLPFLTELWHRSEVAQYSDEFPRVRGWTRDDSADDAWKAYQKRRAKLGDLYLQLIIRLADGEPIGEPIGEPVGESVGEPIGESFSIALREGSTFGTWKKPPGALVLIGDIKLSPEYWGKGLGTDAMRIVVRRRFKETGCDLYCVPPHKENGRARRLYEKVGFELCTGMESYRDHLVMELTRDRYMKLFEGGASA